MACGKGALGVASRFCDCYRNGGKRGVNRRMRLVFGRFSGRFRMALALAVAMAAVATIAAPTDAATLLQRLFGGGGGGGGGNSSAPPNALEINPQDFQGPGYCPELRLLVGGETYATFEREHDGDAKYVRYLGTITDTARECTTVSDTGMSIKIGIAGRVVAGPKGSAGKVTLPLKVTVVKQHGNKVMFSKTYS